MSFDSVQPTFNSNTDMGHSSINEVNQTSLSLKYEALTKITTIDQTLAQRITTIVGKRLSTIEQEKMTNVQFNETANPFKNRLRKRNNKQNVEMLKDLKTQYEQLKNDTSIDINKIKYILKKISELEKNLGYNDSTIDLKSDVKLLEEGVKLKKSLENTQNTNVTQINKLSTQVLNQCGQLNKSKNIKEEDLISSADLESKVWLLSFQCATVLSNLDERLKTISKQLTRNLTENNDYKNISQVALHKISELQAKIAPYQKPLSAPSSELLLVCNNINAELDHLAEFFEKTPIYIMASKSIKDRALELNKKIDEETTLPTGCKSILKADLKPILIKISNLEKALHGINKVLTKEQLDKFMAELENLQKILAEQNQKYEDFCRLSKEIPVAKTFLAANVDTLFADESAELERCIRDSGDLLSDKDRKELRAQTDKLKTRAEEIKKKTRKATKPAEFDQIRTSYIILIRDAKRALPNRKELLEKIELTFAKKIITAERDLKSIQKNLSDAYEKIKNNDDLPGNYKNFLMRCIDQSRNNDDEIIDNNILLENLTKSKIPTKTQVEQLEARVKVLKENYQKQCENYNTLLENFDLSLCRNIDKALSNLELIKKKYNELFDTIDKGEQTEYENFFKKSLEQINSEIIHISMRLGFLLPPNKIPTKSEIEGLRNDINNLGVKLQEQYKNYNAIVLLSKMPSFTSGMEQLLTQRSAAFETCIEDSLALRDIPRIPGSQFNSAELYEIARSKLETHKKELEVVAGECKNKRESEINELDRIKYVRFIMDTALTTRHGEDLLDELEIYLSYLHVYEDYFAHLKLHEQDFNENSAKWQTFVRFLERKFLMLKTSAAEDLEKFLQSLKTFNQMLHTLYNEKMKNGHSALKNFLAVETWYNQKKDIIPGDRQAEKARLEEELNAADFSIEAFEKYIIAVATLIEEQDHPDLKKFFE